jgi:hypothetical protein
MIYIAMMSRTDEPLEGVVLMCRTMPGGQVPEDRCTWGDD